MKIHAMIYIGSIKKKVRIESSVSEGKEEITKCKCMIFWIKIKKLTKLDFILFIAKTKKIIKILQCFWGITI